jgi:hypothetical protein
MRLYPPQPACQRGLRSSVPLFLQCHDSTAVNSTPSSPSCSSHLCHTPQTSQPQSRETPSLRDTSRVNIEETITITITLTSSLFLDVLVAHYSSSFGSVALRSLLGPAPSPIRRPATPTLTVQRSNRATESKKAAAAKTGRGSWWTIVLSSPSYLSSAAD